MVTAKTILTDLNWREDIRKRTARLRKQAVSWGSGQQPDHCTERVQCDCWWTPSTTATRLLSTAICRHKHWMPQQSWYLASVVRGGWGQVAWILFTRTASHRSRGSWGPCMALATLPLVPPSIPQPPTSRDQLKPPQGDLPHLISAHAHSTWGQARPRRPCRGGRGVEPFPWCWLVPLSGCRGHVHPTSTSWRDRRQGQPVCPGATWPESSQLLLPCRCFDEEGLQLVRLQLQRLPHPAAHPHGLSKHETYNNYKRKILKGQH